MAVDRKMQTLKAELGSRMPRNNPWLTSRTAHPRSLSHTPSIPAVPLFHRVQTPVHAAACASSPLPSPLLFRPQKPLPPPSFPPTLLLPTCCAALAPPTPTFPFVPFPSPHTCCATLASYPAPHTNLSLCPLPLPHTCCAALASWAAARAPSRMRTSSSAARRDCAV